MSLVNLTAPTSEPVTLAEGKRYIKEDLVDGANDADITAAIKACRELCENDIRRALINQQWRLGLDYFPSPTANIQWSAYYGTQWGQMPGPLLLSPEGAASPFAIQLPLPPLKTVDAIKYVDTDGNQQTLAGGGYLVDTMSTPGQILPAYGTTWPATRAQPNAVWVDFTCGYGVDATFVPACAIQWIKATLGTVYEMRQSEIVMERGILLQPGTVTRLLDPIRYRRY